MAKSPESDVNGGGATTPRSPRYPSISLRDAATKIKAFYDAHKTAAVPVDVALKRMGYKSRSGPATAALGALRRFGLAEVPSGRVVLTPRGIKIAGLPDTDERRKVAVREALAAPKLYAELLELYKDGALDEDALKHELILDGKYNHNAIPSIVKDFIDSVKYAGLADENGVLLALGEEEEEESSESSSLSSSSSSSSMIPATDYPTIFGRVPQGSPMGVGRQAESTMRIPITLPSLKVAWLEVPQPLSEIEFATLTNSLAMFKEALTKPTAPPTGDDQDE